jgi:hypothetical protein
MATPGMFLIAALSVLLLCGLVAVYVALLLAEFFDKG